MRNLSLTILLISVVRLQAQTDTGVISGTVRDGQQGVLADVKVTATSVATGIRAQLATNREGL